MVEMTFRTIVRMGTVLSAGLVLLAGCDQREERAGRAQSVIEAAIDQLRGDDSRPADSQSALKRARLVERALAGNIRNEMPSRPEAFRSQFAVGSIIAKPRQIEYLQMQVESAPVIERELRVEDAVLEPVEQPARRTGDIVVDRGDLPVIDAPVLEEAERREGRDMRRSLPVLRDGQSRQVIERPQTGREIRPIEDRPRGVEITPEQPVRSLPAPVLNRVQMKAARRSVLSDHSLVVQSDARLKMLDAMDQYGPSGQDEMSRSGQMVLQLGDLGGDPTQIEGTEIKRFNRPLMALNRDLGCPHDLAPEEVRKDPAMATECVVEALRQSGDFEYVEKDFIFTNQFARKPADLPQPVSTTPTDPLWGMQWNFQSNGEGEGQSPGGAGFTDFWSTQANQGSRSVVVAVVDTGLQLSHPDIKDSPNVAAGWDMVSDPAMGNDGDGRDSNADDPGDLCDPTVPFAQNSFHGTHVAGTIGAAATNNGAGVAGGAWNVTIVPVRALGKCGGRLSDINDAIRWAGGLVPALDADGSEVWNENPADIINLSIGLFEYCPASLQDAIDAVSERGVIVVSAAGNARISTKYYAPGGCNNVISVAAGDARGQIAPYSNYGVEVDVLAPGGDMMRDDDGDGRPDGILSTKQSTECYDPVTGDAVDTCYYSYEQGTSMAAPHVSAALALLASKYPDKTSAEIQSLLLSSLDVREPLQCSGLCTQYPGAEPIEGSGDMCLRPCGGGLLNLANIAGESGE